jgi:hypothetical protein
MTKIMSIDQKIVKATIHPSIGIARVGNSQNEFFIGPEVVFPQPQEPGFYKDKSGAIKRQAAKFRIFGYNSAGEVVKELDADNANITWTVHVANKKAAWYNFELAMDIPEAQDCPIRNANITGADRHKLVIDPGKCSIPGKSGALAVPLDKGEFFGKSVYLGELRTDDKGNLIFLGGRGDSASAFENNPTHTFGNNDGWHDDTSDGPVSAVVSIDGAEIPVEPAWVVVAPPNYAPDMISIRTLYDVIQDANIDRWSEFPKTISFKNDIYPILYRFYNLQWVNYGFYVQFGWKSPNDFLREDFLAKLASNQEEYLELRRQIFHYFRNPNAEKDVENVNPERQMWPWIYGDAAMLDGSPRQWLALTKTQYKMLVKWVAGDFEPGYQPNPYQDIDCIELSTKPDMLDRAALHFCLGDAFHPGCEMTWPVRHYTMYYAPFRFRPRAKDDPAPDYGEVLKPEQVYDISSNTAVESGPLFNQGPGDITRWMAVPWQTDTASCRAGYIKEFDPYVPTFWPARVPNHVLTKENYDKVMDTCLPIEERRAAFNQRAVWYRGLKGQYVEQINEMVTEFGKLGIVEKQSGPSDCSDFPDEIYVESPPEFSHEFSDQTNLTFEGAVEKFTRYQKPNK